MGQSRQWNSGIGQSEKSGQNGIGQSGQTRLMNRCACSVLTIANIVHISIVTKLPT